MPVAQVSVRPAQIDILVSQYECSSTAEPKWHGSRSAASTGCRHLTAAPTSVARPIRTSGLAITGMPCATASTGTQSASGARRMRVRSPTLRCHRTLRSGGAARTRAACDRHASAVRNEQRCAEQNETRYKDPDYRRAAAERMVALNTPEVRAAAAKRLSERWQEPEFRAAGSARSSAVLKKLFADPEYRRKHGERQSRLMKERLNTPEAKARQAARFLGVNKRPMFCITTGEYFASVAEAAAAKEVSVSVVNKQCRGLPTRSALQWRYLTDAELIERGYDPSKVRRDMPADRRGA